MDMRKSKLCKPIDNSPVGWQNDIIAGDIAHHNAERSALLCIPGEVRNLIFEFALGGNIITIKSTPREIDINREYEDDGNDCDSSCEDTHNDSKRTRRGNKVTSGTPKKKRNFTTFTTPEGDIYTIPSTRRRRQLLSLLLTCRQLAYETTSLLYSNNIFHFQDIVGTCFRMPNPPHYAIGVFLSHRTEIQLISLRNICLAPIVPPLRCRAYVNQWSSLKVYDEFYNEWQKSIGMFKLFLRDILRTRSPNFTPRTVFVAGTAADLLKSPTPAWPEGLGDKCGEIFSDLFVEVPMINKPPLEQTLEKWGRHWNEFRLPAILNYKILMSKYTHTQAQPRLSTLDRHTMEIVHVCGNHEKSKLETRREERTLKKAEKRAEKLRNKERDKGCLDQLEKGTSR